MSDIDPTDHALATIASILEHPEPAREAARPVAAEPAAVDEQPLVPEPGDADGYTKLGPGPMEAIRLRWTVRRGEDGGYYVEETIGETSAPVVTGPMSGEAAVRLADERQSDAHHRFEVLRNEIAGRGKVAELVRKGGGEA
ncbi:hypothetical protein [Bradyrhizobium sp.]|uniref:hypothetical protein n=1 Tax=Bradyrhizobium sp. TaxID=376 RepID=UPI0023882373|nr:hypothetical protein [Bradyrhizobium sp.]MDE2378895.1 hypothetical protein [Bradyrhizobium sp.]